MKPIPRSDFVVSGKGPETAKNRKWVLTCCACYRIFSLTYDARVCGFLFCHFHFGLCGAVPSDSLCKKAILIDKTKKGGVVWVK